MNVVSKKIHKLSRQGVFNRNKLIIFNGFYPLYCNTINLSFNSLTPTTIVCNQITKDRKLSDMLQSCKLNVESNINNIVLSNCDKAFFAEAYYDGCFENMNEIFVFSDPYERDIICDRDLGDSVFLSERYKTYANKNVNIVLHSDELRITKWIHHVYKTNELKFRYD